MGNKVNYIELITSPVYKSLDIDIDYDELLCYFNKIYKDDIDKLRILHLGVEISENINNSYFYKFYDNIKDIKDYYNIWKEFVLWLLGDKEYGVINYCEGFSNCKKSIQTIIDLYKCNNTDIGVWEDASSAAYSATSSAAMGAARGAASSAAYSAARGAASSAARNAAYSAARNAAKNAAKNAARGAARNAAKSAAWGDTWADDAANSAAWKRQGNYLLEILKKENKYGK